MIDTEAALAPFASVDRGIDEPDPVRAALRAAGPVVRVGAPAGGSVWIVTDEAVARAALVDPRITKDPAWAPTAWDPQVAGLEPPAAAQPSLAWTVRRTPRSARPTRRQVSFGGIRGSRLVALPVVLGCPRSSRD
jgi:hypothetical protein